MEDVSDKDAAPAAGGMAVAAPPPPVRDPLVASSAWARNGASARGGGRTLADDPLPGLVPGAFAHTPGSAQPVEEAPTPDPSPGRSSSAASSPAAGAPSAAKGNRRTVLGVAALVVLVLVVGLGAVLTSGGGESTNLDTTADTRGEDTVAEAGGSDESASGNAEALESGSDDSSLATAAAAADPTPTPTPTPEPVLVAIPSDLVGQEINAVVRQLRDLGLAVRRARDVVDASEAAHDEVLAIEPQPGVEVEEGTQVTVTYAVILEPTELPGEGQARDQVPGCPFDPSTLRNWASLGADQRQVLAPVVRFASAHNAQVAGQATLDCAWDSLNANYRQVHGLARSQWFNDQGTSSFVYFELFDYQAQSANRVIIDVVFISRQQPAFGPNGQACTRWERTYEMVSDGRVWTYNQAIGSSSFSASNVC